MSEVSAFSHYVKYNVKFFLTPSSSTYSKKYLNIKTNNKT